MKKSEFMGMLEIYQKNKVIIKIKLNKIECWENHKPFLIFVSFVNTNTQSGQSGDQFLITSVERKVRTIGLQKSFL